jgi:energy-coupling factor transporter ATP-binding protein EcfA2
MNKRILITGPSGMGKTTLAQKLAKEYNLPFVGVSIKDVCNRYGHDFTTHQDIIDFMKLNPYGGFELQYQLLKWRQMTFGDHYSKGFITDRGHIDSLVYTWNQVFKNMEDARDVSILWDKFNRKARSVHRLFTHIIYLSWIDDWEVEDDGVRVADPTFQMNSHLKYMETISSFMQLSLDSIQNNTIYTHGNFFPYVLMLEESDLERRTEICKAFIEEYA